MCKLLETALQQLHDTFVQTQLDEMADTSSSISDSDNDMPQLSPVTDVSTSDSVRLLSTSVSNADSISQSRSSAKKSVSNQSSTSDVCDTQLYCICRTPYDESKYVINIDDLSSNLWCTVKLAPDNVGFSHLSYSIIVYLWWQIFILNYLS